MKTFKCSITDTKFKKEIINKTIFAETKEDAKNSFFAKFTDTHELVIGDFEKITCEEFLN